MLAINFSRDSEKFLSRLPAKQARQLAAKITSLREDPYPHDSSKLKGYSYFRADSGEYRIIYEVAEQTLLILLVGKRNDDDVYKKLKRK